MTNWCWRAISRSVPRSRRQDGHLGPARHAVHRLPLPRGVLRPDPRAELTAPPPAPHRDQARRRRALPRPDRFRSDQRRAIIGAHPSVGRGGCDDHGNDVVLGGRHIGAGQTDHGRRGTADGGGRRARDARHGRRPSRSWRAQALDLRPASGRSRTRGPRAYRPVRAWRAGRRLGAEPARMGGPGAGRRRRSCPTSRRTTSRRFSTPPGPPASPRAPN